MEPRENVIFKYLKILFIYLIDYNDTENWGLRVTSTYQAYSFSGKYPYHQFIDRKYVWKH